MPKCRRLTLLALINILLLIGVGSAADVVVAPVHHSTIINGVRIDYDAVFDTIPVSEPGHAPGATVTTISYVRSGRGTDSENQRPVVFAFDGGPGAASIFLHVGVLGPERLALPADVKAVPQPHYPLVRNEDSILDVADLVLIDPVGTGFSRLTDEAATSYFYSVTGDAAAIAQAIQAWCEKHHRASSATYILGESYGAVRAVEVASVLVKPPDAVTTLQGLILVSPSLAIVDTIQRRSNIVGQVTGLAMMAATSWYYKRAGQGESLQDFAKRAETFATNEWLPALAAGTSLDTKERNHVAKSLASFTGLPAEYFLRNNLYLRKVDYRRLALADQGLILGEDDSRYTGPLAAGRDPSSVLADAMVASAPDLLRSQLGLQDASDYRSRVHIVSWIYVEQPFDMFNRDDYLQLDYTGHLLKVMAERRELRVFISGGWFDTTASAGAQDYQVSRGGLDLKRVTARHYIGGHMFYTDPESRVLFAKDLRAFVSRSR